MKNELPKHKIFYFEQNSGTILKAYGTIFKVSNRRLYVKNAKYNRKFKLPWVHKIVDLETNKAIFEYGNWIKKPELSDLLKQNPLTTEYFLKSNNWTIEQLDAYADYCRECLNDPQCITKDNKQEFLNNYDKLRGLKNGDN